MSPTRLGGDVCSRNKEVIRLKPAGCVIRELNQERTVPDPSDTLKTETERRPGMRNLKCRGTQN